jgi:4-hydroxybenzoate polyprenyltransferase
MLKKISSFLELMRPKDWYKNLVVFTAIFFSGKLFEVGLLMRVIISFALLSLMSSVIYCINDLIDSERDKKHPEKRKRPIPSGRVSKLEAFIFATILFVISIYFSIELDYFFGMGIFMFFLIGLLYSFILKNIFLVDSITIGTNFFLRAALGAFVIGVAPSAWLMVGTFMIAIFLALVKRKGELDLLNKKAKEHRVVLVYYNKNIINHLIHFVLFTIFVSYLFYCSIAKSNTLMILTIPLATYIIFRLYFLIFSKVKILTPGRVLKDKSILIASFILFILTLIILYG